MGIWHGVWIEEGGFGGGFAEGVWALAEAEWPERAERGVDAIAGAVFDVFVAVAGAVETLGTDGLQGSGFVHWSFLLASLVD